MLFNDYLNLEGNEKRLLKAVIYTLFITSIDINIKEVIIRSSERFKVSASDIDVFIDDLFSIEL